MKSIFAALLQIAAISSASLTVRAQTVSPNDDGRLRWDQFLPRADVNSINLGEVLLPNSRPTADRRAWNAKGRRIPREMPSFRELEMVPIEAEDVIDEYYMQKLFERYDGNTQSILNRLQLDLPGTSLRLAASVYRRVEVDTFSALTTGIVTVRNPQDATKTYTASYGFDAARYETAPTAWNDGGVNAYNLFTEWLSRSVDLIGGVEGVVLRQPTYNAIRADAPTLLNGERRSRQEMEEDISQETGQPFRFEIMENTVEIFDDGGVTKTITKVFPLEKILAIPPGRVIGSTPFAPVYRAQDIVRTAPQAGIDVNGVTVYHIEENDGKSLTTQAQANAIPSPDENKVAVIDAGVVVFSAGSRPDWGTPGPSAKRALRETAVAVQRLLGAEAGKVARAVTL
ncbi:MAG: major capsid protein, partial [Armatimonadota bacterium]